MSRRARNTATQTRHRATVAAARPACARCGGPIDYAAGPLDPLSFQLDHVIPLALGGTDTLDNKQPTHRACNRAKGARLPDGETFHRSGALRR